MPKSRKMLGTVDETETAFYKAMERADVDAMMALWADEEDIVCIHPGAPRLVGHPSIRASWEAIFARGGVRIHPLQLHATQNLMMAVHNLVEEIDRPEGELQDMHILATNVYVKTPVGWRIVVHHASVAPGRVPAAHAMATTLH